MLREEIEYVDQSVTRDHPLPTDMGIFGLQVPKERELHIIRRCKVTVTALGGEGAVAFTIPVEASLAKSGTGGDYCTAALRVAAALLQTEEVRSGQYANAPGGRLEVVQ